MRRVAIIISALLAWPPLALAAFTAARPFKTLAPAQRGVRSVNTGADVVVLLADGIYRLSEPLQFRAADGGQDGTTVTWQAAPNAAPIVVGSIPSMAGISSQ